MRIWALPTVAASGPFADLDAVITLADQFSKDDDHDGMYRAVCLLQTQSLTTTQRQQLEALRVKLQHAAGELLAEVRPQVVSARPDSKAGGRPTSSSRAARAGTSETITHRDLVYPVLSLFNIVAWDTGGKNGIEARQLLDKITPKTIFVPTNDP